MTVLSKCVTGLEKHTTFSTVMTQHIRTQSPKNIIQLRNRGIYLGGAAIATAEAVAFFVLGLMTAPAMLLQKAAKRMPLIKSMIRISDASMDKLLINAFATALLITGAIVHPKKVDQWSPIWAKRLNELLAKPLNEPKNTPQEVKKEEPQISDIEMKDVVLDISEQELQPMETETVATQVYVEPPQVAQNSMTLSIGLAYKMFFAGDYAPTSSAYQQN